MSEMAPDHELCGERQWNYAMLHKNKKSTFGKLLFTQPYAKHGTDNKKGDLFACACADWRNKKNITEYE